MLVQICSACVHIMANTAAHIGVWLMVVLVNDAWTGLRFDWKVDDCMFTWVCLTIS